MALGNRRQPAAIISAVTAVAAAAAAATVMMIAALLVLSSDADAATAATAATAAVADDYSRRGLRGTENGNHPAALTPSSPPSCEPPNQLDPKAVFNLGCRRFKWMCIDQQQFITYDPRYSPGQSTERLPYFDVRDIVYNWPNPWGNGDKFERGRDLRIGPVVIRANTSQEASEDLRHPVFSKCTFPIIIWQRWMFNVGEVFEASYVRLFEEFAAGRIDPRMTPVMGTPHGLRLPAFMPLFFSSIFEPEVITLADISQRPPGPHTRHDTAPLPTPGNNSTREGYPVRCFEKLYLCKIKNRKDDGHCAAGQYLLRHYEGRGRLPALGGIFSVSRMGQEGKEEQEEEENEEGEGGLEDTFKVVFASRPNATGRAILNEEELLEACNQLDVKRVAVAADSAAARRHGRMLASRKGRHGSFPRRRIKCISHVFGHDLLYDLALAKVTDVLVATHGAAGYHSFYMPAGSSLVEILPYKFSTQWANLYYARMLEYEKKVFYWSIWITDPANSRESSFENTTVFRPEFVHRERHVTLPWAALRQHLREILKVAGRPMSYKEVYMSGTHSITEKLEVVRNTPDTGGMGWASYNGPT